MTAAQRYLLLDIMNGNTAPFIKYGFPLLDECLACGWVIGIDNGDWTSYHTTPTGRAALAGSLAPEEDLL